MRFQLILSKTKLKLVNNQNLNHFFVLGPKPIPYLKMTVISKPIPKLLIKATRAGGRSGNLRDNQKYRVF